MANNKLAGDEGEDLAAEFLKRRGLKIIERNFRTRNGEIDILAIDKREKEPALVCIEVKTRSQSAFGTPLESITYFKLKALKRTLEMYKSTHRGLPDSLRIDAVSVYKSPTGEVQIEHHENIVD